VDLLNSLPSYPELLPLVAKGLADKDPAVRSVAAHAISESVYHEERWDNTSLAAVIPKLLALAEDRDWDVQLEAIRALGNICSTGIYDERIPAKLIARLANTGDVRKAAHYALSDCGGHATPALLKGLNDHDPDVRKEIAEILGDIGDPRIALVPLAKIAQGDPDAGVREAAKNAINELTSEPGPR
jgi:HEAT repeat protein